jgi:methylated-DNA-[protein]-cysteine S-methyltransferase
MESKNGQSLVIETPIGNVEFLTCNEKLTGVDLYTKWRTYPNDRVQDTTSLQLMIRRQVEEYFEGRRKKFELPLKLSGTDFQQRLYQRLLEIPYGKTMTYGELAKQLGSSPRAVGGACRRNPIPLIIPCHRVVAAKGLGGFSGATEGDKLTLKIKLLQLESGGEL